jgi:hypothetical protein
MQMIEHQTRLNGKDCVKFVKRTNDGEQRNYLRIQGGLGCWSHVGMSARPSDQLLTLQNPGCLTPTIVAHELIHALGISSYTS